MQKVECYVGLGGNEAGSLEALSQAVRKMRQRAEQDGAFSELRCSSLYLTTPVSEIAQPDYLNAVCGFKTNLALEELWQWLQALERALGKQPKPKAAPRLVDLDLLFYGSMRCQTETCTLPHPSWRERLFVLIPLAELTDSTPFKEEKRLSQLLAEFPNSNQEFVRLLNPHYASLV